MRTDATIDRKQVVCRNSSHLGYSKVTLEGDAQPIRNWLIVARLSNDLTSVSERWVNPELVTQVFSIREETRKLLSFFLSPEIGHESIDNLRRWTESGFSTVNDWLAYEVTHESQR